jgi:hypothetical protein
LQERFVLRLSEIQEVHILIAVELESEAAAAQFGRSLETGVSVSKDNSAASVVDLSEKSSLPRPIAVSTESVEKLASGIEELGVSKERNFSGAFHAIDNGELSHNTISLVVDTKSAEIVKNISRHTIARPVNSTVNVSWHN